MIYWLQFVFSKLLLLLLRILPLRTSQQIARSFGGLAYGLMAKRRKIALENLNRAFGASLSDAEKERLARASFENSAMSILDLFLVEKAVQKAKALFTFQGLENAEKAFQKGKGVILVISHLGSWEFLSFLPYLTDQTWSVIVKDIKNPYMNQEIDRLRRVMTVTPVPKKNSIKKMLMELKKNHGVAILIDQWDGPNGLWMDFFGEPTSTTSVPARLAEKTGAALVPAYCIRNKAGEYEIQIHPEVTLDSSEQPYEAKMTEKLNRLLEDKIRQYPECWSWGHRRWKPKPSRIRQI